MDTSFQISMVCMLFRCHQLKVLYIYIYLSFQAELAPTNGADECLAAERDDHVGPTVCVLSLKKDTPGVCIVKLYFSVVVPDLRPVLHSKVSIHRPKNIFCSLRWDRVAFAEADISSAKDVISSTLANWYAALSYSHKFHPDRSSSDYHVLRRDEWGIRVHNQTLCSSGATDVPLSLL